MGSRGWRSCPLTVPCEGRRVGGGGGGGFGRGIGAEDEAAPVEPSSVGEGDVERLPLPLHVAAPAGLTAWRFWAVPRRDAMAGKVTFVVLWQVALRERAGNPRQNGHRALVKKGR